MTELIEINKIPQGESNKTKKKYHKLLDLLSQLKQRELTSETRQAVNEIIENYNKESRANNKLSKLINKTRNGILSVVEKKMKLIPRNAMMIRWMSIGMAGLGIPMGVAYGAALGNMAFMGVGIAMGMSIGVAIGIGLDNKAKKEGRQLDIDL